MDNSNPNNDSRKDYKYNYRRRMGMKERPKREVVNGQRQCSKCSEWFPNTAEYFYRSKQHEDGLRPDCKSCNNGKKHKWRKNNWDKVLADGRTNYYRNLEANREKGRIYSKRYYREHKEECNRKWREYYQRTRSQHRARKRKWERENIEKRRTYDRKRQGTPKQIAKNHRRAARKQSLPDNFTDQDWQHALDYFGGCCAVCGNPPGLWHTISPDHWIPLAAGDCTGTVPTNIVPLCHALKDGEGGCNNQKHHQRPDDWLTAKYGKRKASQIMTRIQEYFESLG